ncbi:MAG: hypothetical protein M3256_03605 [Actinomycetota bacterium]|nr:hypothetical protein [Actinomycetota bacterium]
MFGLAVQGVVHPDRVWTRGGARPGDAGVLSKPLGSGIVLAGGRPDNVAAAIMVMRRLNPAAADALSTLGEGPHAVTDVTGSDCLVMAGRWQNAPPPWPRSPSTPRPPVACWPPWHPAMPITGWPTTVSLSSAPSPTALWR